MDSPAPLALPKPNDHWKFVRDVAVFQLKMAIDNLRDFALVPVSLGAAIFDLIFKGQGERSLFYKVLEWGAHSERMVDVYSAIEQRLPNESSINPNFTIDGVIARLERIVVHEVEKGGTAASVKAAMDRAIDQLHGETGPARDKVTDLVERTIASIRKKI